MILAAIRISRRQCVAQAGAGAENGMALKENCESLLFAATIKFNCLMFFFSFALVVVIYVIALSLLLCLLLLSILLSCHSSGNYKRPLRS